MPFGEKLEVWGTVGVRSGVGKELLRFGEGRKQRLHGCLIGNYRFSKVVALFWMKAFLIK